MARINNSQLIHHATNLSHLAYLANQVQKDPAVQKSWREFRVDFGKAAKSLKTAAFETRSAWNRVATGGGNAEGTRLCA